MNSNQLLKYGYLVIVFMLFFTANVEAQTDTERAFQTSESATFFDRSEWEALVDDADYFKGKKKKEKEEDKQEKEPKAREGLGELNLKGLQYVFIGIAIALLAYFLLRVFAAELFTSSKKVTSSPSFNLEDVENNVTEAPLRKILREAIAGNQYRLAIRIYYLLILQTLDEQQLIKWHKEKTNARYQSEMQNHPSSFQFNHITQIFERIWYGLEEEINPAQFEKIEPIFRQFIITIEKR